jgi:hypothetical protein
MNPRSSLTPTRNVGGPWYLCELPDCDACRSVCGGPGWHAASEGLAVCDHPNRFGPVGYKFPLGAVCRFCLAGVGHLTEVVQRAGIAEARPAILATIDAARAGYAAEVDAAAAADMISEGSPVRVGNE